MAIPHNTQAEYIITIINKQKCKSPNGFYGDLRNPKFSQKFFLINTKNILTKKIEVIGYEMSLKLVAFQESEGMNNP